MLQVLFFPHDHRKAHAIHLPHLQLSFICIGFPPRFLRKYWQGVERCNLMSLWFLLYNHLIHAPNFYIFFIFLSYLPLSMLYFSSLTVSGIRDPYFKEKGLENRINSLSPLDYQMNFLDCTFQETEGLGASKKIPEGPSNTYYEFLFLWLQRAMRKKRGLSQMFSGSRLMSQSGLFLLIPSSVSHLP